ncbi:hypothetical protein [Paenibacillus sp. SI8]|uniref:hypothetical protein n=1 Tax=unclassified Paenibacillus TaxID=185978 RepID=UPI003466D544
MEAMLFNNINEVYHTPNFELEKSSEIKLSVELDQDLTGYDKRNFPKFVNKWSYPNKGKYIKPFSLIRFNVLEKGFEAEIRMIKKDAEIDELKLFCKDMLDIFHSEKIIVIDWRMEKI